MTKNKPIRILIISGSPWDDNNSFGNTFSNIFGGDYNYEIANIYLTPGLPNTKVCNKFFQITEKGIIKSIFSKQKTSGNIVFNDRNGVVRSKKEEAFINKLKIIRWQIFIWFRDLIWSTEKWKTENLDAFIKDFNPDLILQPIYYSSYLNEVGIYAKKITDVKMVGFISDDCYTLKQFSLSPFFWIDRLIKRPCVKKAIDHCEILYTITETQKEEYNYIFGEKCKLLFKGGDFDNFSHKKETLNNPIKLVYTGNLGSGRWRSLAEIAKALGAINKDEVKAQLLIYSQTALSSGALKKLNIEDTSFFKGAISSSEVKIIQKNADILIHVESFNLSERYSARLSFSTKIVDYFEAGRCILAVGWEKTGAIQYLKKHNAAVVVTDRNDIFDKVKWLIYNPKHILEYGEKSFMVGKKNHQIDYIRDNLYNDLFKIIEEGN